MILQVKIVFVFVLYFRVSILDSATNGGKDSSSISIDMKSAYVLIRNVFMSNIHNKAISVRFNSENTNRISEASISQNSIFKSAEGGAIFVNNHGVNNATVWITGNTIMHNTAFDVNSVVEIINTTLIMHSNLLYNNTGKYIVQLGSSVFTNTLHQLIENNTFWLNAAQLAAFEFTVSINATNVDFHGNALNNPANLYEVSVRKGLLKDGYKALRPDVHCGGNWWGSGRFNVAKRRIRDGRNTRSLPFVKFMPILREPPSFVGLTSKFL